MKPLDLHQVREYVNQNVVDFHQRRTKSLEQLNLRELLTKNPYLFKAKNIITAGELIAGLLDLQSLQTLAELGRKFGMEPLVEIHDEPELRIALDSGAELIGINNRDLKTFNTDLNVTVRLAKSIPEDRTVISESGIKNRTDILRLADAGVRGFLIGEGLVTAADPEATLKELIDGDI